MLAYVSGGTATTRVGYVNRNQHSQDRWREHN